jgi:tetratricopeptide (TPR) repeat protein
MIRLGKPELALLHFREAERLQPNYPPTQYNIASYYAVTNDAPRAVQELKKAIAMFPKMKSWLATDPDFDNIRSDPEFQKLQN